MGKGIEAEIITPGVCVRVCAHVYMQSELGRAKAEE